MDLLFGNVGQVEGYLKLVGQGHRSKVKVTRSKMFPWTSLHMYICNVCRKMMPKNRLTNTTARNTATWGVSKADAFFLFIFLFISSSRDMQSGDRAFLFASVDPPC